MKLLSKLLNRSALASNSSISYFLFTKVMADSLKLQLQPHRSHRWLQKYQPPSHSRWKTPSGWLRAKPLLRKQDRCAKYRKKAVAEAAVIIANNRLTAASPRLEESREESCEAPSEARKNVLTTQWLSVISILASIIGPTTNAKRKKKFSAPVHSQPLLLRCKQVLTQMKCPRLGKAAANSKKRPPPYGLKNQLNFSFIH